MKGDHKSLTSITRRQGEGDPEIREIGSAQNRDELGNESSMERSSGVWSSSYMYGRFAVDVTEPKFNVSFYCIPCKYVYLESLEG